MQSEEKVHWPLRTLDSQKGKGPEQRAKGRVQGQGVRRKGWEPHLCSPEQVTRVESLSPELRGQLRDPHTSSRPQAPAPAEVRGPSLGPRPKTLGWEGPRSPLHLPGPRVA